MSTFSATQWYRLDNLCKSEDVFDAYLVFKNQRAHLNSGWPRKIKIAWLVFRICHFPAGRQLAEQRLRITLPAWRQAQVHALRVISYEVVTRASDGPRLRIDYLQYFVHTLVGRFFETYEML